MAQIIKHDASNISIVWHDDLAEILEAAQSPENEVLLPLSLLDDSAEWVPEEIDKIRKEGAFDFFDHKARAIGSVDLKL